MVSSEPFPFCSVHEIIIDNSHRLGCRMNLTYYGPPATLYIYPPGTIFLLTDHLDYLWSQEDNITLFKVENGSSFSDIKFAENGRWQFIFMVSKETSE